MGKRLREEKVEAKSVVAPGASATSAAGRGGGGQGFPGKNGPKTDDENADAGVHRGAGGQGDGRRDPCSGTVVEVSYFVGNKLRRNEEAAGSTPIYATGEGKKVVRKGPEMLVSPLQARKAPSSVMVICLDTDGSVRFRHVRIRETLLSGTENVVLIIVIL